MVMLMCHTHYTLTQHETPALIVNTWPIKINKKQMLWMYIIIIEILNGKHARPASRC